MVHIETENGEKILTVVPSKAYQSIVLSSSQIKRGETYRVYTGGSSTGTNTDGLYSGGIYTAGTQVTEFTIANVVTKTGSAATIGPGGAPGGGRPAFSNF